MRTLTLLALCILFSIPLALKAIPLALHRPHHRVPKWHPDTHRNTATAHAGIGGVGAFAYTLGLEYERCFTKKRLFSIAVPVSRYKGGTFGGAHSGQIYNNIDGYYVAPGVCFHPMGSKYRVDPAIGAFLLLGHEKRLDSRYGDQGYSVESRRDEHFIGALLGQASVTFYSPDYFVAFGFFATGGYIFSHTHDTFSDQENSGDHLYLQFGVRLGAHW